MGKITVKHYLNKDLKPEIKRGEKYYPIYVQVFVAGKSLRFKSDNKFIDYLAEQDLDAEITQRILCNEKENIIRVVSELVNINRLDLVTSKNVSFFIQRALDRINENFGAFIRIEYENQEMIGLPSILYYTPYSDIRALAYFFGSLKRLCNISENVSLCVEGLEVLWNEINDSKFLVFDFSYGENFERISSVLKKEFENDVEKSNKTLKIIQNLFYV